MDGDEEEEVTWREGGENGRGRELKNERISVTCSLKKVILTDCNTACSFS